MRIDGKENENKKTSGPKKTRNRLKESRTKHKLFILFFFIINKGGQSNQRDEEKKIAFLHIVTSEAMYHIYVSIFIHFVAFFFLVNDADNTTSDINCFYHNIRDTKRGGFFP